MRVSTSELKQLRRAGCWSVLGIFAHLLLTNQTNVGCLSNHLIRVLFGLLKMAESDWRAQIERVLQNDPTLTELE
jgi:hypothetical protein